MIIESVSTEMSGLDKGNDISACLYCSIMHIGG